MTQDELTHIINEAKKNYTPVNLREADLAGADLSGADLAGAHLINAKYHDIIITKPVKQLYLDPYHITIIHDYLKIGCEEKKLEDWLKLNEKEIKELDDDNDVLAFYDKYKNILVKLTED